MDYEFENTKIIGRESSGKLAHLIRIKPKRKIIPGQYYLFWVPGFNNIALPISSYKEDYVEFLITKNNEASNILFQKNIKDEVSYKGPLGHGFPMNNLRGKEIIFIGQTSLFAPLFSVYDYIINQKEDFGKVSFNVFKTKPKKGFIKRFDSINKNITIAETINDFINNIKSIKKDNKKVFLISSDEENLKKIVFTLLEIGINSKQIYIYLNRKISCGKGICGRCMTYGFNVCDDGPVFKLEKIMRLLTDE